MCTNKFMLHKVKNILKANRGVKVFVIGLHPFDGFFKNYVITGLIKAYETRFRAFKGISS